MNRVCIALASLSLLQSCAQPQQAPKDVDGLARFFWNQFWPTADEAQDVVAVELQDASNKLFAAVDAPSLSIDAPLTGLLEDLSDDDMGPIGDDDAPTRAQGMFIADIVSCPLDKMADIIRDKDQKGLYPEAYAAYERLGEDDRRVDVPLWRAQFTTADNGLFSNQFTAETEMGLRTVPETEDAKHGALLVRAGYLPKPAAFENPSENVEFSFDVQVETYAERAPGEIVHFYAMWRYMKLGVVGDSNDQIFIDQTINGMIDWDKKTNVLCQ